MKREWFNKTVSVFTAAIMTASLFAGCGTKEPVEPSSTQAGTSSASADSEVQEPTEISYMVPFLGKEPIDNKNVIWQELEKRTNTKLSITFVPNSNYTEKLSVTVAGGTMPDVTHVNDPMAANIINAAMNGAFWEVGSYIKDYPNLSKYPEIAWTNTKYPDGKNYSVPRPRPTDGAAQLVDFRIDWLEKLNLEMPQTPDDIYNALKAFVNDDPDGNNQKDTTGLVGFISPSGTSMGNFVGLMGMFTGAYFQRGYFMDKDGTLQSALTTPEFKESIAYLRKLYAEGLIHKDFATMKQQQVRDIAMSGKTGAITEAVPGSWVVTSGLRKVDPKGEFVCVPYLVGPSGRKFAPKYPGYNGVLMIRKQDVDEAKMKKILKFMDDTSSDEIYELANYGFKDIHFTKNGDVYTQTPKAEEDHVGTVYMGTVSVKFDKYFYAYNAPGIPAEQIENNKKIITEMGKVSVGDVMEGLISDTWTKYGKEFDKKTTDQIVKIIIGTESIDSWDAFAASMVSDANYKKGLAELQAAYKVKMGK